MNSEVRGIRTSASGWLLVTLTGFALLVFFPAHAGAAGTGSISGTVTESPGDPVAGVCAQAYHSAGDGLNYVSTDETGEDGSYKLEGLGTGNYRVRFLPCSGNVLREWFDDKETFDEATPVPVTDGSDTADIDAELATGGSISGRVLNAPGGTNSNTCVDAYGQGIINSNFTQSGSNGEYRIVGLETGQYRVEFSRCGFGENVAREYYPDKGTRAEATPVTVTAGSDTPGIDAQLEQGATISGVISSRGPSFAPYMCFGGVRVFDAGGDLVDSDESFEFNSGTGGGSGGYRVEKLKPGNVYRLSAGLSCGWIPLGGDSYSYSEYYSDKGSLAAATPISVTPASAVTGIDIELDSPDPHITAPDTVIDTGPSATITTDEATFAFRSTDPANTAGFECRLDSGDFAHCTSPKTFLSLSQGPHTFSVRARHAVAGNEDQSPASRSFTVDTIPPVKRNARISKLVVKGPAKVKMGSKARFRVRITNSGNVAATGVRLKVAAWGTKRSSRIGRIPAATTRTVRLQLRPKKPGKSRIAFRVTSSNGGSKVVRKRFTVE